jgi:hypothetical protein
VAEEFEPVKVTRKIEAEPGEIFALLANPARHQDFDGTGMLRTAASEPVITRVGDEFTMNMFFEPRGGDYQVVNRVVELVAEGPGSTLVTEIYDCSGVSADLRKMLRDGTVWEDAMTKPLERLDALVGKSGA